MYQKVVDLQFIRETAGLSNHRAFGVALRVVLRHIHVSFCTGKSLPEAFLFGEHWENMLCTEIVLDVKNNFCTQHVLPRFELRIFMY